MGAKTISQLKEELEGLKARQSQKQDISNKLRERAKLQTEIRQIKYAKAYAVAKAIGGSLSKVGQSTQRPTTQKQRTVYRSQPKQRIVYKTRPCNHQRPAAKSNMNGGLGLGDMYIDTSKFSIGF